MNSVSIPTMEPDRQYYFMNQCKTLVLEKKAALNRPLPTTSRPLDVR